MQAVYSSDDFETVSWSAKTWCPWLVAISRTVGGPVKQRSPRPTPHEGAIERRSHAATHLSPNSNIGRGDDLARPDDVADQRTYYFLDSGGGFELVRNNRGRSFSPLRHRIIPKSIYRVRIPRSAQSATQSVRTGLSDFLPRLRKCCRGHSHTAITSYTKDTGFGTDTKEVSADTPQWLLMLPDMPADSFLYDQCDSHARKKKKRFRCRLSFVGCISRGDPGFRV